ncbi:MAG: NrsF family protein [Bryobacteraceae bacterium]
MLVTITLLALIATSISFFPYEWGPRFLPAGFRCWRAGIACAAAIAPLFWLLLRRGVTLNPIRSGATAGFLAGIFGLTVLTIECNYLDSLHLTIWHLGAVLTTMLIGAGIGHFARARQRNF